ncbi:MAG: Serine/threonine protein kinase PrkC, regulation of stationary phase [Myxococcaceae bacterium]|nr:Serine/threonine protein kinase PrkC, regulation of stationary phase [Myxococcaceae bacterium]
MNTSILGQVHAFATSDQASLTATRDSYRPAAELPVGACLQGKYTVLGVLGHGGFAVVYDAEHVGLARRVAIKVLHVGNDTPLALIERFRREARISAMVHHPNVLEVYDTGQLEDGSPYLVMERVNGENLSALIRRGPLSIATTVEIGRQLLLGLSAIADAGIVHRDVKPDNIMLHDAGDGLTTVKLVDFGISRHVSIEPHARLTCHGALVGTPQYMSPEQIRGEDVDARTDIYAAGAVLYEALAGTAPHASDNFSELVVAVLNSQVRPLVELRPNCPPELERIILTALARARAQRYASPRHLLEALDEFACVFELPRGASAFRPSSEEERAFPSAARSSTPGPRRLWGFGLREAKLPLQVACVTMLALAPKLLSHDSGAARATTTKRASPAALQPAKGAMDPLTLVSSAPLAVPAGEAPADTALPSFAQLETPTVVAVPIEPAPATTTRKPRIQASGAGKGVRVTGLSANGGALPPVVATAAAHSEPEPELTGAQRAAWQQTMQAALSAMVRGRLVAAQDAYREAVRLAPREASGFRGLGLVSARLGDSQAARAALKRYLVLAPKADDAAAIASRLSALPN